MSAIDQSKDGTVVLPGDQVGRISSSKELRIGPGLVQAAGDVIVSTRAGVLRFRPRHRYWYVDNRTQRRYVPALEDLVVGVVVNRTSEALVVDVGAAVYATLPALAFEGATKRNRPRIAIGDAVYARVVAAARDVEPELECMSVRKKADGFGELAGGTVLRVSLSHARALMEPDCPVLRCLGELIPYEVAVGLNGRVWIKAQNASNTILVSNAIANSEWLNPEQVHAMVVALFERFQQ